MSKLTSFLYRAARASADADSVVRAAKTGSPTPIIRRLTNKFIGRTIASKMWWKGRR